jgi:hypothetical protein
MDAQDAAVLFNKAKLAAHLRGLVLMQVGVKAFRDAARNSFAGNTQAKRALLEALADQLADLKSDEDWCTARGTASVSADFKAEILGDDDGGPGAPAKSDAQLILAFTSPVVKNKAGKEVPGEPKLVGFVTFGEADPDDRTFDDGDVQAMAESKSLLEVDLICTNGAPVGTGSILLCFAIAKELKRKSRGSAKYDGVYLDVAEADVQVKKGRKTETVSVKPLLNVARRMGFEATEVSGGRLGDEESNPMVLTQFDDLIKALPDMSMIETVCATRVRNGIPYCA